MYERICYRHKDFRRYFPDYDANYVPQREFFWSIFMSLFRKEAEELIKEARLKKIGEEDEEAEMITVHPAFHQALQNYSSKACKLTLI